MKDAAAEVDVVSSTHSSTQQTVAHGTGTLCVAQAIAPKTTSERCCAITAAAFVTWTECHHLQDQVGLLLP